MIKVKVESVAHRMAGYLHGILEQAIEDSLCRTQHVYHEYTPRQLVWNCNSFTQDRTIKISLFAMHNTRSDSSVSPL